MTIATLDEFTSGYVEALFWAENGDDGEPLDREYSAADLAPEALGEILADCAAFQAANAADIEAGPLARVSCGAEAYAGHDFWLTRNGHGCGFWDGDWPDGAAERLDASARGFGNCNPYVGDDGKIYLG